MSQSLNITHILPAIGRVPRFVTEDGAGGISSGTLSLANAQQMAGHMVSILSWTPVRTDSYRTCQGVSVDYVSSWTWAKFIRWDLRWLLPAYTKTVFSSPHILHVHSDPNLLLLTQAQRRIFHLRTPVPTDPPEIYGHLVSKADAVVCNSYFTAQSFLSKVKYPANRVFVAHNGADEEFFAPNFAVKEQLTHQWSIKENMISVVFAGALVEEKGVSHAIEAIKIILQEQSFPIKLIIIGGAKIWPTVDAPDGLGTEYNQQLKVAANGLPIHFAGVLSREKMPNGLAVADIVVVPSIWEEPFGTIVCEAMAAGKPVVAYRSGGIVETVVDGVTGFLIPKGDVEKLADAILSLAKNPELRIRMGIAARQRALTCFTWKKTAEKLNEIYSSVLG